MKNIISLIVLVVVGIVVFALPRMAGNNAETALAGLREMGAAGAARLLERALAVFPGGKPPADRFKRQEVMQQIAAQSKPVWSQCDSEFYKLTEDLGGLSLAFAKKKRAEIVLP
jgi:hypothetical protein